MRKDNTWKIKLERIRRSKLWAGDMALLAARVLEFLEENNKTQRWLAEKLDVSPQQITKIVKGRQNLSWGKIKEIEAVLGIKLARIEKTSCSISTENPQRFPARLTVSKYLVWPAEGSFVSLKRIAVTNNAHIGTYCDHVTDDEVVGTVQIGQDESDKSKRFAFNS